MNAGSAVFGLLIAAINNARPANQQSGLPLRWGRFGRRRRQRRFLKGRRVNGLGQVARLIFQKRGLGRSERERRSAALHFLQPDFWPGIIRLSRDTPAMVRKGNWVSHFPQRDASEVRQFHLAVKG